jgi:two-component system copper resistance phosphate regulon response regulator CusR
VKERKILIVEDEPKVAMFIKKGLEENQFDVHIAEDGAAGKKAFLNGKYDLVILDINLPDMNGYELCKAIRRENTGVAVLMLTALSTTEDKLTGFDSGADDYLVKPFEFRELLARIKVLVKRTGQYGKSGTVFKIADLELNTDTRMVKRGVVNIDLTAKEFALLELLIRNEGKVISRTEIAEKIWDINFDTGTNVIDVYINFLRKKIDRNFSVKLIHTYIGVGYSIKETGA